MVILCESELLTQHHNQSGHGAVKNDERILYAVFDKTKLENGQLFQKSFESSDLKNNNLSVCRVDYTTRAEFDQHVARGNTIVGGGLTIAGTIREITYNDNTTQPKKALCVHDRVEPDEYDGHATLAYAASIHEIQNQTTKGSVCARIRGTLAQLMQPIFPLDEIQFRETPQAEAQIAEPSEP